jgi:hypothetical protein
VVPDYAAPGHVLGARAGANAPDATRATCKPPAQPSGYVAAMFRSCQRLLCGLESSDLRVVNYVSLLTRRWASGCPTMQAWKNAGSRKK